MDKKGLETWISWVLMLGLAVAIGVVMYSWYISTTQSTIKTIQYVYDRTECNSVAVSVTACSQAQHLNINITNKLYIAVDEMMFRIHYSDMSVEAFNSTARIKPGQKEDFVFGFDSSKAIAEVEAIPVIAAGSSWVICSSRAARVQGSDISSC
jgi:hypothetical protein